MRRFAFTAMTLLLALSAFDAAATQPPTPYWSIDIGRSTSREQALARLGNLHAPDPLRAEQRRSGWYLRAGTFKTRAEAEAARKQLTDRLVKESRVVQIENAAPWLTASGDVVPVPGGATVAAAAPSATAVPAAPAPKPAAKAPAPAPEPVPEDLTTLELDQLMAMEVTGVTRRAGSYAHSPAAIYVLTGEDIRRSGARTIADALRLVPGLQVVRTNAQSYTVTARGFGGDKLQVLLDDRSVYTPLTSTVFWDVFDTYLEDIARIEVIRGPGASVYGANAVNGVINIVTRSAGDTLGTHGYAGFGDEERAFGGVRTGGRLGDWGKARAYVKAREVDSTDRADGSEVGDGLAMTQAGGRIDANLGGLGTLVASGDVYDAREYSTLFNPSNFPTFLGPVTDTTVAGRNASLRWTYDWGGGATTQTHLYYDGYDRVAPSIFEEHRDTYDVSVQHNLADIGPNRITLGLAARTSKDSTGGPPYLLIFQPADATHHTSSAFLQDELTFGDWQFVAGTKVEHNEFSGTEIQPGIRLGWAATQDTFTWASVSRATRTPNRLDRDVGILCTGANTPIAGCPGAGSVISIGSPNFDSEKLIAYEWGLRMQASPTLVTDLALFYNDYGDLRSTETGLKFANLIDAEGYGGELSVAWDVLDWAKLTAFYGYVKVDARKDPSSTDTTTIAALEGGTGQQSAGLRLGLRPCPTVTADAFLRYVDNLQRNVAPTLTVPNPEAVPHYTELNLRLGWSVTPVVELSVTGENLFNVDHPESGTNTLTRSEIPRSVFGALTWRWQ